VAEVCAETEAERVVVGLPLNMDGSPGPMAEKVRAFVTGLEAEIAVPVDAWDERLSTRMVERVLLQADVSRAKRKKARDKLAAQVILQGYLDARLEPPE
jgi:putative Holliday junction resolvase